MTSIATALVSCAVKCSAAAAKSGLWAAASVLVLAGPVLAQGSISPAPSASPSKGLTLEHRMLLKCSAAFALVAHGQAQGQADMLGYKLSAAQGREYFVQAMAQVMDDTGFSREEVTEQLTQEAQRLSAGNGRGIAEIMPACEVSLSSATPPAMSDAVSPSGVP